MESIYVTGFVFLVVSIFMGLLYVFDKESYRRIDRVIERVIGRIFGNVVASAGIVIIVGSLSLVVYQVYVWLSQGHWVGIPLSAVTTAEVSERIFSVAEWMNALFNLDKTFSNVISSTPLSIFLVFAGFLIALLGSVLRQGIDK